MWTFTYYIIRSPDADLVLFSQTESSLGNLSNGRQNRCSATKNSFLPGEWVWKRIRCWKWHESSRNSYKSTWNKLKNPLVSLHFKNFDRNKLLIKVAFWRHSANELFIFQRNTYVCMRCKLLYVLEQLVSYASMGLFHGLGVMEMIWTK